MGPLRSVEVTLPVKRGAHGPSGPRQVEQREVRGPWPTNPLEAARKVGGRLHTGGWTE